MFTKIMHDNRMRWKYGSAAFPKLKVLPVVHSGGKCSIFSLRVSGHDVWLPQILLSSEIDQKLWTTVEYFMYILNLSWAKKK